MMKLFSIFNTTYVWSWNCLYIRHINVKKCVLLHINCTYYVQMLNLLFNSFELLTPCTLKFNIF